jgi:hypothetical protein
MAVTQAKSLPFKYIEKNSDGRSAQTDITLDIEFDTELKRTFVYKRNEVFNFTTGRTLLGTLNSNENNIVPFKNENGQFNASDSLRSELANNSQLKEGIIKARDDSARQFLSIDGAFNPSSIPQQELDKFLGTNNAETEATQSETQSGQPGGNPNGGADAEGQPVPIPIIGARPGTNAPSQFNSLGAAPGSAIRYPENPGDDEDYIKFDTFEYKPKTLKGLLDSPVGDNLGAALGTVILPIQSQISDSNTVGWGDGRVNAIELAAFNAARSAISDGFDAAAAKAGKALNEFITGDKAGTFKNTFQVAAAAQAAQVNDVFARTTGGILNPNLELIFQGPELRSFNFQFQLSPRSEGEAGTVRDIIRFFKAAMSVQRSNTDVFLKSPNVFKIQYFKGGKDHKSLNKFKTCALRSFSVDYTPLGTYMTFDDSAGTMVSYLLNMQFQEIDPIYNDDYQGKANIGF